MVYSKIVYAGPMIVYDTCKASITSDGLQYCLVLRCVGGSQQLDFVVKYSRSIHTKTKTWASSSQVRDDLFKFEFIPFTFVLHTYFIISYLC